MNQPEFDFAVFGTTPLAHLLAGLLATRHDRRVMLIGEGQAGYRLPRNIDLSVGPITRPESWAMVTQTAPETARLVTRVGGRSALGRTDPIYFAVGQPDGEALSHIRHMAAAFGVAAEPVAPSLIGESRQGIVLRDALHLHRPALEIGMGTWLAQAGVTRVTPQKVTLALDGLVEVQSADATLNARQAVLADDESLMAWLPLRQWPTLLRRRAYSSILTTPTRPLAGAIMLELNSGFYLLQQAEGGIASFGPDELAPASAHLQALLGHGRQVEQAGQTQFQALVTRDGAPAFGRAAGVGADVIAGLGPIGAFLAPALARWLAGEAASHEVAWFEGRLVNRSEKTASVDEFIPGQHGAIA